VPRRETSPGCGAAGPEGMQAQAARAGDVPLGGGPVLGLLGALGWSWWPSSVAGSSVPPRGLNPILHILGFLRGRVGVCCWQLGRASGLGHWGGSG